MWTLINFEYMSDFKDWKITVMLARDDKNWQFIYRGGKKFSQDLGYSAEFSR